MSGTHLWFHSGNHSLLGHFDAPRQARGSLGVVIVPPFGWEDVCCYRPLRFMAKKFAAMGLPTLRYDLPGTGDSSGGACDPGLFDAWIQSVADAAEELRHTAGVEEVAAVGIHMGALLALIAQGRGANLKHLVLWGLPAKGRALIRELRATANIERWEHLAEEDAPPQPLPGLEASGFLLSPETQQALEQIEVSALPPSGCRRILLLSRDELPHDANIIEALQASGSSVEAMIGHGYAAMTGSPQGAVFPEQTSTLIAERLISGLTDRAEKDVYRAATGSAPVAARLWQDSRESVYPVEIAAGEMFGILSEPASGPARTDVCILYLNPGGVRHTGPNRMWVESARRWAAHGITSLRIDVEGIGESDGEQCVDVPGLYRNHLVDQIDIAIHSLRRRMGVKRFIAVGLCSGACWAFHAAAKNPSVSAAILVNPSLLSWDPGADRRRILRPLATGFSGWANWSRLVFTGFRKGDVHGAFRRVAEVLGRTREEGGGFLELGFASVERAWLALEQARKRVTLIFREGEPLLAELEAEGQLPSDKNRYVRCIRVPNAGHTLRPLWAQKLVHELIDGELERIVRPASLARKAQQPDDGLSTQTLRA